MSSKKLILTTPKETTTMKRYNIMKLQKLPKTSEKSSRKHQ
jgi:hypothetical protein